MIDGTITYDCCRTYADNEEEQNGWKSVFLDWVDDGFPFLVRYSFDIRSDDS